MKTLDYLAAVCRAAQDGGYCNRERASQIGQRPTSEVALDLAEEASPFLPLAEQIRAEFMKDRFESYFVKLKVALINDNLDPKDFGLAASAIPAYERIQAQSGTKPQVVAPISTQRHVGLPGWKMFRTLTLVSAQRFENEKGPFWLHSLIDAEGNRFSCFIGESSPWFDDGAFCLGEQRNVYARVKEHTSNKGIPETRLKGVSKAWNGGGECELYSDAWRDDSKRDPYSDVPRGFAEMSVTSLEAGKEVHAYFRRGRGASSYIDEESGVRELAKLLPGRDLFVQGKSDFRLHWVDKYRYTIVREREEVAL